MAAHVLVADDEPQILTMVSEILKSRGYTFDLASDGLQALELARQRKPDLLVTDVMMPSVDGWTLVRELRADPKLANLPVIFVTALATKDDRLRAFRLGADDYINKPFQLKDLIARIDNAVKQAPKPSSPAIAMPAGLNGDLAQVSLSTLLVLVEMERKTGVLQMRSPDGRLAKLSLRDGRIVDARLGGLVGPECVYELLTWTIGTFEFTKRDVDVPDRIQATTTHLLMEGARRMDEANATAVDVDLDDDDAIAEWDEDERTPMMVAAKLAGLVQRSAHSSNPPPFASIPQIPLAELMARAAADEAAEAATAQVPAPAAKEAKGPRAPAPPPEAVAQPAIPAGKPRAPIPASEPALIVSRPPEPDAPRVTEPEAPPPRVTEPAAKRTTWPWLAVALVAAAAGAATFAVPGRKPATSGAPQVQADAALVARAIDQAAESARMRADGFAALPMLRAGIETDAATLQDMASNEALMKPAPDEIIEVFQTRGGRDTSVLRLPAAAPSLGAEVVHTDGTKLWIAARTAIKSQAGASAGAVVVAEPADLAAAKQAFADHATGASLPTTPAVVLSPATGGATSTVPLATKTDVKLSVVVAASAPATAASPSWLAIARIACFAIAGVMLVAFLALRARGAKA